MANDTAGRNNALWEAGGVCDVGDGDGSRAFDLQTKGPAHPRPADEGERERMKGERKKGYE